MTPRLSLGWYSLFLATLLLLGASGCKQQAATPVAATSAASGEAAASPAGSATAAATPGSVPASAPAPEPVQVAAGRTLAVRLDSALSSRDSDGQPFHGRLSAPVTVAGAVVIPAGAVVEGTVVTADPSGQFNGRAHLELRATHLRFGGQDYALATHPVERVSASQAGNSEKKIGGGAVIGGVIGALAGGGKGAAIGAGAGAGIGAGAQAASGREEVVVLAETVVRFTLNAPLEVAPAAH